VSGFELTDLQLRRDDGANLLGAGQTLASDDGGKTWSLSGLAGITAAPGRYTLVLGGGMASGIVDEAGNPLDGGAGEAWVAQTAVVNAPAAPDLESASDSGARPDDNATTDDTPTFTGVAAGAVVKIYANGTQIGGGAVQDGAYRITTAPLADGLFTISARVFDEAGNSSALSPAMTLKVDRRPPRIDRLRFNGSSPASANVRSISITFAEDMPVRPQDLLMFNLTTGQVFGPAAYAFVYDAGSTTATWKFPGFAGGLLPDGEYLASLSGALKDAAGNPIDANGDGQPGDVYTLRFVQLAGDANRDGVVDHRDFEVLRQHFGQGGSAEDGDFTGDGGVDFADFQFLEKRFGRGSAQMAQALAAPIMPRKPKLHARARGSI
jgi:hypothetical protein